MKAAVYTEAPGLILTKRAVVYTRVSSQGQQDHGTSLGSQLDACTQYATQHGFQIAHHADEGAGDSGTQDRPALQHALDMVKNKQADVFLCYDVDRLSRDVFDQWDILKQVERAGGELHFVLLPPQDSDSWQFLFAMKGVMAQFEKRTITRRTSLGKHASANKGNVLGSWMVPYGFRYVKGEGRLEPVEDELLWVRRMYDWCVIERCTLGEIARRLNAANVPTKRGLGRWQFTTIRDILINPTYAGKWYWNKTDQRGRRNKTEYAGMQARPRDE